MYANGMGVSFHSEPHVLAGTITPTIGRCNISLPMENGLNSIEWRLRKEQIKGKVTIFGRKLRVSRSVLLLPQSWRGQASASQWRGECWCLSTFRRWETYSSGLKENPSISWSRWADSQGASAGEGVGLHCAPDISPFSCHYLDNATHESGLVPTMCLVIF